MKFPSMSVVILLLLCSAHAGAQDWTAGLIGDWISPDGQARQSFRSELDGSLITVRMWFRDDDDWKAVGSGVMYRKPGAGWRGVSRAVEMGPVLFESEYSKAGSAIHVRNRSYAADGTLTLTEEEWLFPTFSSFDYTVYKVSEAGREAWFRGSWRRQESGGISER